MYLLHHGERATVVDPTEAAPVLDALEKGRVALERILLTHHHSDHNGGCLELVRRTNCLVAGPDDSRLRGVDERLRGGECIYAGDVALHVLLVPGHTRSHLAFHAPGERAVWTGDCLFLGGCGRVFEGSMAEMLSSLEQLRSLPDETLVYPGHEYTLDNLEFALELEPENAAVRQRLAGVKALLARGEPSAPAPLALEKRTNPFLRADSPELKRALGLPGASTLEVFTALRQRKDEW